MISRIVRVRTHVFESDALISLFLLRNGIVRVGWRLNCVRDDIYLVRRGNILFRGDVCGGVKASEGSSYRGHTVV